MALPLTPRIALELVAHEAIVTEAYRDPVGIWTWGVGVTQASGHAIDRYRDAPQDIAHCLSVYVSLLRDRYLPDVERAFAGQPLTEAQTGAALSFHYNTGAIGRAGWVAQARDGDASAARQSIIAWNRAGGQVLDLLTRRRARERDLFFDGTWSSDGTALVIPVAKPSYAPDMAGAERVDIRTAMAVAFDALGC